MTESMNERYTDDAPISGRNADRFGRWPFARRVASVIAARIEPSSLVVGIYGPWGDGKTSVLNMMTEELNGHDNVIVVPFNPWNFENESQLIRAFFDTLSDVIGKALTTKAEEVGQFLGKYGGVLSFASLPFGVDFGAAATAVGEKLSNVELDELKHIVMCAGIRAEDWLRFVGAALSDQPRQVDPRKYLGPARDDVADEVERLLTLLARPTSSG